MLNKVNQIEKKICNTKMGAGIKNKKYVEWQQGRRGLSATESSNMLGVSYNVNGGKAVCEQQFVGSQEYPYESHTHKSWGTRVPSQPQSLTT